MPTGCHLFVALAEKEICPPRRASADMAACTGTEPRICSQAGACGSMWARCPAQQADASIHATTNRLPAACSRLCATYIDHVQLHVEKMALDISAVLSGEHDAQDDFASGNT